MTITLGKDAATTRIPRRTTVRRPPVAVESIMPLAVPRPPVPLAADPIRSMVAGRMPSPCPLAARVELLEEGAVIHLTGLLVSSAATAARAAVCRAAALDRKEIIADLGGVRGADPLGAVLLGAMVRHAARSGARLRFRNAGGLVRRALADRGVRVELIEPTG